MAAQPVLPPFVSHYPVVVRPEPVGQFTAQPLGLPDIQAVAATAQEALRLVQQSLAEHAASLHWVPVALPPGTSALPPAAGHAQDDPDHDQYLEEIQRFRQEALSLYREAVVLHSPGLPVLRLPWAAGK